MTPILLPRPWAPVKPEWVPGQTGAPGLTGTWGSPYSPSVVGHPHILLLTPSLWPLHQGARGRAVADLVDAIASAGTRITILTTTEGCVDTAPLARRLEDLDVVTPAQTRRIAWFEGHTPSNSALVIAVASTDWIRLGAVALREAARLQAVDVLHAIDEAAAALFAVRSLPRVATLTELPRLASEAWSAGIEGADAVVLPSRAFAQHPTPLWRPALTSSRSVRGITHGAPPPKSAAANGSDVRTLLDLRRHLPLAVTHGPIDLRRTGDLEAIVDLPLCLVAGAAADTPAGRQLAGLAARAPHRIAVLDRADERLRAARRAADLHIFGAAYYPNPHHPLASVDGVAVAHSSGAFADSLVHWDPASQSGNGFRFTDGELVPALRAALRALGSETLRARAAELPPRWQRAGAEYQALYCSLASSPR